MIYLELLLGFLKVGSFTFGGAYSAIPLIRDVVLSYGWLSDAELSYMIAVSESTPGPIMVNLATYVGSSQAGFLRAVLATLAVALPSFFVILLVMNLLGSILKSRYAQAVLQGLKPCMIGIILATGLYMTLHNMTLHNCFPLVQGANVDFRALLMTAVLTACIPIYRYLKKEKPSPILLIIASAVLGIIIY